MTRSRHVGRPTTTRVRPNTTTITVPADLATRLFRSGFNRIAIRSLGVARVDAADDRLPDLLARRPDTVWPVGVYDLSIAPLP